MTLQNTKLAAVLGRFKKHPQASDALGHSVAVAHAQQAAQVPQTQYVAGAGAIVSGGEKKGGGGGGVFGFGK